MRNIQTWPVELISARHVGERDDKPTPLSHYFVIVTHHRASDSYTVWAEPDHERAIRRLLDLSRSINPETFNDASELLYESNLEKSLPHLRSIKMKGIVAAFYAHSVDECATLALLLKKEVSDEFNYTFNHNDPPS